MPQPQSVGRSAYAKTGAGRFDCAWRNEGGDATWVCPAGELDITGQARVHRLFTLTGIGQDLEILDLDPAEPQVQALLRLAQEDRVA